MSILAALQAKVDAVDSSTSMSEILKLMYTVKDHPYKSVYDSAGVMPLDSASIGSIRYADNRNAMYMLVGVDSGWKLIDSDASTAAGGGTPSGSQVQGSAYGFKVGGEVPSDGVSLNVIDRYSFTSDANATDYGDLTVGRGSYLAGCTENDNYGYAGGGYAPPGNTNIIDRFPYASAANAVDVGDLSHSGYGKAGCSSTTHGYAIGGTPAVEVIDKFPFAASANASDIGDFASSSRYYLMSASSSTTAYAVGGNGHQSIEKVPFASDGSMTNITGLTLLVPTYSASANSSETHGYTAGGYQGSPTQINTIQKFPFASEDATSDVGDMTRTTANQAGSNSTTHGYAHGGQDPPGVVNNIEKWSYSADGNATDVGDLSTPTSWYSAQGGIQV